MIHSTYVFLFSLTHLLSRSVVTEVQRSLSSPITEMNGRVDRVIQPSVGMMRRKGCSHSSGSGSSTDLTESLSKISRLFTATVRIAEDKTWRNVRATPEFLLYSLSLGRS